MKTKIKWIDGVSFVGESGSGHAVVIDGAPEHGGRNIGVRPVELVLMGAAACSAFDVVHILKKARQPIDDCTVEAEAERAPTDPKVFTRIHMHFTVRGRGLKRNVVEHAIRLSHEKYCSASIMLGKTAEITKDFAIIEE
jgi:putative redox protein